MSASASLPSSKRSTLTLRERSASLTCWFVIIVFFIIIDGKKNSHESVLFSTAAAEAADTSSFPTTTVTSFFSSSSSPTSTPTTSSTNSTENDTSNSYSAPASGTSSCSEHAISDKNKTILFGYMRLPSVDSTDFLAGILIAIREANQKESAIGYEFRLETYQYPFCSSSDSSATDLKPSSLLSCDVSNASIITRGLADFIGNMSRFHAILSPQHALSAHIIAAAEALKLPIIDPNTVRPADYLNENLFLMSSHHVATEVSVLTRYMFTAHSCAHTGVMYSLDDDVVASDVEEHLSAIEDVFELGGYPKPTTMGIHFSSVNFVQQQQQQIRDFYFGVDDSARVCFIVLTSGQGLMDLLSAVVGDERYAPNVRKLFAWSYTAKTISKVTKSLALMISGGGANVQTTTAGTAGLLASVATALRTDVYTTLAFPPLDRAPTEALAAYYSAHEDFASAELFNNPSSTLLSVHLSHDEATLFGGADVGAKTIDAFHGYITALYPIEVYSRIAPRHDLTQSVVSSSFSSSFSSSASLPENVTRKNAWDLFINTAYSNAVILSGDYPFARPIRSCLPKPLTNTCQCNVLSRMAFMLKFDDNDGNGNSGAAPPPLIALVSVPETVEQPTTAVSFSADLCELKADEAFLPTATLLLTTEATDEKLILPNGITEKALLQNFVKIHNEKGVGRKRRVVVEKFPPAALISTEATNAFMEQVTSRHEPYVILSSDARITNPHILTIASNASYFALSDPPLTKRPEWNENVLLLMPTYADYAHTLASYYAAYRSNFTSFFVMVTSVEEAELVLKSFHTFQVKLSMEDIFISEKADEWIAVLLNRFLLDTSVETSKPFIFASCYRDASIISILVSQLMGAVNMGIVTLDPKQKLFTMAFGEPDRESDLLTLDIPAGVHLLSASIFGEWWMPSNPLQRMAKELGAPLDTIDFRASYYIKSANYIIANQLAMLRTGSRTAAEVLYTARTASYGDIPLGPFSNDTCSDDIIERNEADRTCQCSKGFRLFRVFSLNDMFLGRESVSTGRYIYQMTTCGVKYMPYVEPPSNASSLFVTTNGVPLTLILSIAVPCALLLLIAFAVVVVYLQCFAGRNNRHAPKDSDRAFTVAFTDIQSSTLLWSRCPHIMSDAVEHHSILIRRLIRKHRGYEVKTIGDSFMVAFKNVENSVDFSAELQEVFYRDDWWPLEIDQHYREIIAESEEAAGVGVGENINSTSGNGVEDHHQDTFVDSNYNSDVARRRDHRLVLGSSSSPLSTTVDEMMIGTDAFVLLNQRKGISNDLYHQQQHTVLSLAHSSASPPISSVASPTHQVLGAGGVADLQPNRLRQQSLQDQLPHQVVDYTVDNSAGDGGGVVVVTTTVATETDTDTTTPTTMGTSRALHNYDVRQKEDPLSLEITTQIAIGGTSQIHQQHHVGSHHQWQSTTAPSSVSTHPNTPNNEAEYRRLWRGIRVRVGIHFGFGEIRKDDITQGYDYFGTIVNTAARVEGVGHGGQTLVTEAVVDALPEGYILSQGLYEVNLGPQLLRGLDDRVTLIQLLPSSLAGRRFPSLRLDVEKSVEDEADDFDDENNEAATVSGGSNAANNKKQHYSLTPQGLEAMAVNLCHESLFHRSKAASSSPHHQQHRQRSVNTINNNNTSAIHLHRASSGISRAPTNVPHVTTDAAGGGGGTLYEPSISSSRVSMTATRGCVGNTAIVGENGLIAAPRVDHHPYDSSACGDDTMSYHSHKYNHNNANGAPQTVTVGHATARATVQELLYHYHYLTCLFATSSEAWRKDTLKHLASRWQIRLSSREVAQLNSKQNKNIIAGNNNNNATNANNKKEESARRARILMQIAMKAMLAHRRTLMMASSSSNSQHAFPFGGSSSHHQHNKGGSGMAVPPSLRGGAVSLSNAVTPSTTVLSGGGPHPQQHQQQHYVAGYTAVGSSGDESSHHQHYHSNNNNYYNFATSSSHVNTLLLATPRFATTAPAAATTTAAMMTGNYHSSSNNNNGAALAVSPSSCPVARTSSLGLGASASIAAGHSYPPHQQQQLYGASSPSHHSHNNNAAPPTAAALRTASSLSATSQQHRNPPHHRHQHLHSSCASSPRLPSPQQPSAAAAAASPSLSATFSPRDVKEKLTSQTEVITIAPPAAATLEPLARPQISLTSSNPNTQQKPQPTLPIFNETNTSAQH